MIGTIYALADPDTHNVRYCGKTTRKLNHRMNGHRQDARNGVKRHLYNWLRSVYATGREPNVVVCEEIDLSGLDRVGTQRVLDAAETRWIIQFKALGFDLTNATNGGDGCHSVKLSDERKAKLNAHNALPKSAETIQRISETKKRLNREDPSRIRRGERNPAFGVKQTLERVADRTAKTKDAWAGKSQEERKLHGDRYRGESNVNARITEEQALAIYTDARSYNETAKAFGVTKRIVSTIRTGHTWKHVTNHTSDIKGI